MKKTGLFTFIFSLLSFLLLPLAHAYADSITWGYYDGMQELGWWGTERAETYNVAMRVGDASLVGNKVTALRIPINTSATYAVDYNAFLTKEIVPTVEGKVIGDIANVSFTPDGEWATVELPEAYTVGTDAFYVGFSFTVTKAQGDSRYPLVLMVGHVDEGMMIVTSRTYRKVIEYGHVINATLPVQLVVEGDVVKSNAVGAVSLENLSVKHDETAKAKLTVANHGNNAVESIDWTYTVGGQMSQGHSDVRISADFYGTQSEVEIGIPAVSQTGLYEGTVTITKVNGVDNSDISASVTNQLKVMNVVPVKRPLLEEFTGTWCGYCPRGWVGMKLMNEWYPGDFICASYHNNDAMQITTNYPMDVQGFPYANFDRHHDTDAFSGDTNKPMGIEMTWLEACQELVPANVAVKAYYSEDGTRLIAESYVEFCEDVDNADYGVAYIVTADGLSGRGGNWIQHSYYSGDSGTMYGGYMDQFCNGAPEYQMLEYDDVVIAQSHDGGKFYTGMFPASVKETEIISHETEFELSKMKGMANESLVQDRSRLNVIALLIDAKTGSVVNCGKAHVEEYADGIASVSNDLEAEETARYAMDGTRVSAKAKGVNIVRMNDGSVHKIIVK